MAIDPTIVQLDRRVCGALDRMPRLRVLARDVYDELDWLERELAPVVSRRQLQRRFDRMAV
jgi:hypothetical protein